jgi:hypothetical protein
VACCRRACAVASWEEARIAKRTRGQNRGRLRRRNRARSRPCARSIDPHEGDRPKASGPPWRERPPVALRGCLFGRRPRRQGARIEGAYLKAPMVWGPSPKVRWLRHCNCARSRPCARPTGPHRPKRSEPPWRGPPPQALREGGPPGRFLRAAVDARRRGGGPCPDESESGIGHLAMLATPPVLSGTHFKGPQLVGRDSESKGDG